VSVYLPASQAPAAVSVPAPPKAERWRGSGLVLLVDDEPTVVAVAREMLEWLGFEVLVASDGAQAVALFQAHCDALVCVVLDLKMPVMDGEEAFDRFYRIRDDVPVILSSGYGEDEAVQRFAGRGLAAFIQKPYRVSELEKKLRNVLGM
jgi:CheY-like chemotaxis protein